MAKSYRIERVNETIKEIIGGLILNGIKDPRVGLVSITAVRASGDLAFARVRYSVMGDEEAREKSRQGLVSATGFIRKVIAKQLKVRMPPELIFEYDDSLDRAMRIEEKLREVGLEGEGSTPPETEEPAE